MNSRGALQTLSPLNVGVLMAGCRFSGCPWSCSRYLTTACMKEEMSLTVSGLATSLEAVAEMGTCAEMELTDTTGDTGASCCWSLSVAAPEVRILLNGRSTSTGRTSSPGGWMPVAIGSHLRFSAMCLRHRLSRRNKHLRKIMLNNKIYIPNKNTSTKLRITTDVLAVQLLLLVHVISGHALTPNITQLPSTATLVH